jgi:4-diphosphocytidyl-2-C-methyl-D-erythritol kinase
MNSRRPMAVHDELVRAPAKVNLYLQICGKRADGYHLIDSLMVPITLCDDLLVAVRSLRQKTTPPVVAVSVDSQEVPSGPDNLAYRAASAFIDAVQQSIAVNVRIRKRIPPGSGLGGGSSDAAAVLLTLNRVLGHPLPTARLADLGAELGADVPFFIYGRTANVSGVGKHIVPTTLGACLPLVLCSDGYALSTGRVYAQMDRPGLSLTTRPTISNIAPFVEGRKPFTDLLVNDLEEAAGRIHPEVLSLKARVMEEGAQAALMTGSGSAVFGVCANMQSAAHAAARLRRRGLWAEAVRTLDLSPVLGN